MKITIGEMRRRNSAIGHSWFSKETMKAFSTKICTQPNKNLVFITSEKDEYMTERKFTIRQFDIETSTVKDLSDFMEYHTLADAKIARDLKAARLQKSNYAKDIHRHGFMHMFNAMEELANKLTKGKDMGTAFVTQGYEGEYDALCIIPNKPEYKKDEGFVVYDLVSHKAVFVKDVE